MGGQSSGYDEVWEEQRNPHKSAKEDGGVSV